MEASFLIICNNRNLQKISLNEISYVRSLNTHVQIVLKNKQSFVLRMTLQGVFEHHLVQGNFAWINSLHLANVEHIRAVRDNKVVIGGLQIPIERIYADKVVNAFRSRVERQFTEYLKTYQGSRFIKRIGS